jgi:putative restriction endonuclease
LAGGFYAHFTRLPLRLAWDLFGVKNGAPDLLTMASLLRRYRSDFDIDAHYIGCLALTDPFSFPSISG